MIWCLLMKRTRATSALPSAVRRALSQLGADLSAARRRRRIPLSLMAERAFVSRNTISRVERGDPSVSMGIYATVLFVLGLTGRLTELAAGERDVVGLGLEEERLPQRIRTPRARGGGGGA